MYSGNQIYGEEKLTGDSLNRMNKSYVQQNVKKFSEYFRSIKSYFALQILI